RDYKMTGVQTCALPISTEAQGPGVYNFNVIVSDGALTDTKSIQLTVNEVNVAPVLADVPASATIDEEALYSFQATATDHDLPANERTISRLNAPNLAST